MTAERWPGRGKTIVRDTGDAVASEGGFANSGVVNGAVVIQGRPLARSAYLEQVRRMCPDVLHGRDDELEELRRFCSATDAPVYVWWRAPAWAGKSALMSWLALHPPEGTRLVSFFITARWSGQSDRTAFTDVVIEQLAEVLQEPLPWHLTEATRDQCFLDLLRRAAATCAARNERLVLLVDGLDEDRGVTADPGAHSIAALLPADPPENLRIIVTGRPNPPVPYDVPERHPLRDAVIARPLAQSPVAKANRQGMVTEVHNLLRGTAAQQDLLGFVAAAGGGLSVRDLAELADLPLWQVTDHLQAAAGRTFGSRRKHWSSGDASDLYVLGHEELQVMAVERIGVERIDAYTERIHRWADGYEQRGWPAETPEYLLRGYLQLLRSRGDVERVIRLASDGSRHDRMLDLSGGDAAAHAEIEVAFDLVNTRGHHDLLAIVRLAKHCSGLCERSGQIPSKLPALWARLGYTERAKELATAIPDPVRWAQAMCAAAVALGDLGDMTAARELADEVGAVFEAEILRPYEAERIGQELSTAWLALGDFERAQHFACSIVSSDDQGLAIGEIVRWLVKRGSIEPAEALARAISAPAPRVSALVEVADAIGTRGECGGADDLIGLARGAIADCAEPGDELIAAVTLFSSGSATVSLKRSLLEQIGRIAAEDPIVVWRLVAAAHVHALAGERDSAVEFLRQAEAALGVVTPFKNQVSEVALICAAELAFGNLDRAHELATAVVCAESRSGALNSLARSLGSREHPAEVCQILDASESIAMNEVPARHRARTLSRIVEVALEVDEIARAERISRAIVHGDYRAGSLTAVAHDLLAKGDERAIKLAADAEHAARSTMSFHRRPWAAAAVKALLAVNEFAMAEDLAEASEGIVRHILRARTAVAKVSFGDTEGGRACILDVANVLGTIENPIVRAELTKTIVGALVPIGDLYVAVPIVRDFVAALSSMPEGAVQLHLEHRAIEMSVAVGDNDRARKMTMDRLAMLDTADQQAEQWADVVVDNLLSIGELQEAEVQSRRVTAPVMRIHCLSSVAGAAARHDDLRQTERLLAEAIELLPPASRPGGFSRLTGVIVGTIASAVQHLAAEGRQNQAGRLLRLGYAMAESATDHVQRDVILSGLVECHLALGQIEVALEFLDHIAGLECRAVTLMLCAEEAPIDVARPLFVQALCIYETEPRLTALGRLDRHALLAFSRELERELLDGDCAI